AAVRRYHENAAYDARMRLVAADPAATAWAQAMEDAYFTSFAEGEVLGHAALARRAQTSGAAAEGHIRPGLNASEVVVAAPDRPRLFVDLAQAVTAAGANVMGARVFTSRQGQALDVFYVQDVTGAAYGSDNPKALTRLADALEAAARGEPLKTEAKRLSDFGRAAAFSIIPTVMLDNDASEVSTVVEASGRDRPGLLEALAQSISEAGLSILSAHIDGYGERAVDAFYVVDAQGEKLTDPKAMTSLKADLMLALDAAEASASSKSRGNLQRARASVAR
ncbi:MAG: bifunctional uridylyltransferase/uridylyl-removing protein, partial [Pseudomonadota bacterium]